jgi:spoIIIJ-associated protein
VSDRAFTGGDVAEAVAAAARALGVDAARLRYVVLDAGTPGGLGIGGRPARIAVLLEAARPSVAPSGEPSPGEGGSGVAAGTTSDMAALLRGLVRSLAEAAGVDLAAELEETEGALTVRLEGPGRELLLEEEGEVLRSLEHLLQRAAGRGSRRRVVVSCPGYQDARDEGLRAEALALAAAVRGDGRPRETRPLNAYERRVIHVALSGEAGLRTFSVGEGAERRVTVAPAAGEPEAGG